MRPCAAKPGWRIYGYLYRSSVEVSCRADLDTNTQKVHSRRWGTQQPDSKCSVSRIIPKGSREITAPSGLTVSDGVQGPPTYKIMPATEASTQVLPLRSCAIRMAILVRGSGPRRCRRIIHRQAPALVCANSGAHPSSHSCSDLLDSRRVEELSIAQFSRQWRSNLPTLT
jgi:hypothetical protein